MERWLLALFLFIQSRNQRLEVAAQMDDDSFIICTNSFQNSTSRKLVEIQYEFRLEVNNDVFSTSSNSSNLQSDAFTKEILDSRVDANLLNSLQSMLPHGGTTNSCNDPLIPNVHFVTTMSEVYSACFTRSDQCSLVRTVVVVEFAGAKPEGSIQRVAYRLVQEYLQQDITNQYQPKIIATYLYPYLVSSVGQFQLRSSNEDRPRLSLTATEIGVLETSFMEVFGAIVSAIEGDVEITQVQFVSQDSETTTLILDEAVNSSSANFSHSETTTLLSSDLKVHGICRECSQADFSGVIFAVIQANLNAYLQRLRRNGILSNTKYFSTVDELTFSVPKLPPRLPAIEDESIYDSKLPSTNTAVPNVLYIGVFLAFIILAVGCFYIWRDVNEMEFEKEDDDAAFSTGSESVMGNSVRDEEEDVDMEGRLDRFGVEEYDVKGESKLKEIATDGTSLKEYQVEAVWSNEDPKEDGFQSITYTQAPGHHILRRQGDPRLQKRNYDDYIAARNHTCTPSPPVPPRSKITRRISSTVSPATGRPQDNYAY